MTTTRRRMLTAVGGFAALAAHGAATGEERKRTMDIKRGGSQPSGKGPADWFTGTVRIDPLFGPPEPARVGRRQRHVRARARGRPGTPTRSARP